MSIQKYKITLWKQLYYAWTTFLMFIVFLIVPSYVIQEFPKYSSFWTYVIFLGMFAVFHLPLLILHAKYYSLNKNIVLIYDFSKHQITIKNRKTKQEMTFTLDDIKYVFHTESGSGLMPWNRYNYNEIYLQNGKKFIITCLLASNLKLPIGERYEKFSVYYPYPK